MSFFSYFQVICWYGCTNTYYSIELAVVKTQELNSMGSKRLQNYIIWIVHQFACLESLSWSWIVTKENYIKPFAFSEILIDILKYRASHIDGHFFPPKKLTSEVHCGIYWFKSAPACWIDLQFVSLKWNLLVVKILKYKVFERHSSATKLTLNLQDWKLVVWTWVKTSSKNDDAN